MSCYPINEITVGNNLFPAVGRNHIYGSTVKDRLEENKIPYECVEMPNGISEYKYTYRDKRRYAYVYNPPVGTCEYSLIVSTRIEPLWNIEKDEAIELIKGKQI